MTAHRGEMETLAKRIQKELISTNEAKVPAHGELNKQQKHQQQKPIAYHNSIFSYVWLIFMICMVNVGKLIYHT